MLISDEFIRWHLLNIGIGLACMFAPRALGIVGVFLVFAMPALAVMHMLFVGLPLAVHGLDKSSGPLVFRIAVALLALVGPALTACAWYAGRASFDWCC